MQWCIILLLSAVLLFSYPQFISWEIQKISNQSYKIITWCRLTILNRKTKNKKRFLIVSRIILCTIDVSCFRLQMQNPLTQIQFFPLHLEFLYHFQPFRIVKSANFKWCYSRKPPVCWKIITKWYICIWKLNEKSLFKLATAWIVDTSQ